MNRPIVKKHKHVVVLMLENRSFDHIMGDFPGVNGLTHEHYNLLNPYKPHDPTKNPKFVPYPVTVLAQPNPVNPAPPPPLNLPFNPGHSFGPMMADIFGPWVVGYSRDGIIADANAPVPLPKLYGPKYMGGFVSQNPCFDANYNATVMSYFQYLPAGNPGRLNVLHTLAEEFVLCDNWFCDTPAMTMPNRNFMHLATNLGNNDFNPQSYAGPGNAEGGEPVDLYEARTIYELLDEMLPASSGTNWAMYGFPWDEYDSAAFAYTSPAVTPPAPPANFVNANRNIFDLPVDLLTGNLPFYTFIMPSLLFGSDWANGNSMHPAGDVRLGENLIASVYNVLRNSPIWNETLLIVTFDENGGIYDHEPPPMKNVAPPGDYNYQVGGPLLFDYSMLGPRIPALLISPWTKKEMICKDQLQNTSILRFVEDLAAASSGGSPRYLTERDRHAPSFANSDIWTTVPRTDCPGYISLYPGFPNWGTTLVDPHGDATATEKNGLFTTGPYIPTDPPSGQGSTYSVSAGSVAENSAAYSFAREYCAYYPGHPDSGKLLNRKFQSLRDLRDYMVERRRAAQNYYHANRRKRPEVG